MEEHVPLRITAYTKGYVRKGVVTAPASVGVQHLWDAPSVTTFVVDSDHKRVDDLVAEGARCTVEYQPRGELWRTLMSGMVTGLNGQGGALDGQRDFAVLDDWDEFNRTVGYPVPGAALSGQGAAAYDVRSGPAETVLKGFMAANVAGQSLPHLTVEADAGEGADISVKVRMHPLSERLWPAVSVAGLGARIVQTGATRQVQTWVPATYPRVLTEESSVVAQAEFSRTPPEVTRVIVACGGEAEARVFKGPFVDSAAEALWGIRRTEVIDARDIAEDATDLDEQAEARALERLAEGAAKASLKAQLVESERFQFGKTFDLGDVVSIKPAGGSVVTDRVREVQIDWTPDDGLTVVPLVGEWQDSQTDSIYKLVRSLLRRTNDLGMR